MKQGLAKWLEISNDPKKLKKVTMSGEVAKGLILVQCDCYSQ